MRLLTKFFLTISLQLIILCALIGTGLYVLEKRFLIEKLDSDKQAIMHKIAGVVSEAYLAQDPLMLINYLKLTQRLNPEAAWLCVTGADGAVEAGSDPDSFGSPRSSVEVPLGLSLASIRSSSGAGNQVIVEAGFDDKLLARRVEESLSGFKTRLIVAMVISVILGFFGSFLLAINLSRPIRELSSAAAAIGEGRFTAHIPDSRADELGGLARSFNSMADQLKELDELKQDFVSSTTHELRSPLSVIDSHINAMSGELTQATVEPAAYKDDWLTSFTHIQNSTARLNRFISDLLNLAKIERGRMEISTQPTDLNMVIAEIGQFFAPRFLERGIDFHVDADANLPSINADAERLHQVFTNLITNAIKFTPAGGHITLAAHGDPGAQAILVSVSDNGPGIAPEFMKRLFGKFEQEKRLKDDIRGPSGTGLGLAICKGIVESHGGKIWAESQPGKGTSFKFTLPIALKGARL
ncbi:MAG: HAMP domain-containing sensor histidine kinase [Elusimicrobiota bacterium]